MLHKLIYASKKTESHVDMKEAKRMTVFNIMINVSRNGIKAIMKMSQLSIYKKQDEDVVLYFYQLEVDGWGRWVGRKNHVLSVCL